MSESRHSASKSLLSSKFQEQLNASKALKSSILSHFDHAKYSIMTQASRAQLFSCELIAVFLFTFTFCSSVNSEQVDAQAAGAILIAIFMMTPFCGANINPMVTLSNCIKKENKYKWNQFGVYFGGQLVGAIAGLFWSQIIGRQSQPQLQLSQASDILRVIANQGMGMFIFILFMLLLSNPNTTFIQNQLTGYISIAIFYHIARSFAPFAGLAINPAITLALVIQYATKGKFMSAGNCWAWLIGDIIGCLLATYFYQIIYEPIVVELRSIRRKSENFESLTEDSGKIRLAN